MDHEKVLPKSIQQVVDESDRIAGEIAQPTDEHPTSQEPVAEVEGNKEGQADELEKMRSRYNSLRGKYDSEVPRLNAQLNAVNEQIQRLTEENRQMKEKLEANEQASYDLTDEDSDNFGADMVDMVRRGAKAETAKLYRETERLKQQIASMEEHLNQTAQAQSQAAESSARERFTMQLGSECADWERLNTDQEFIAWLQEPDPIYGFSRQEALNRAAERYDGHVAAQIFNAFLSTKKPKSPLEKQVAPGYHASQPSADVGGKRVWTSDMIAQFYEGCRRGIYTAEQAKQLEAEIDQAVASGAVRG